MKVRKTCPESLAERKAERREKRTITTKTESLQCHLTPLARSLAEVQKDRREPAVGVKVPQNAQGSESPRCLLAPSL